MDGSEINRRALALQRMTMDAMLDKVRELEREIVDLRAALAAATERAEALNPALPDHRPLPILMQGEPPL